MAGNLLMVLYGLSQGVKASASRQYSVLFLLKLKYFSSVLMCITNTSNDFKREVENSVPLQGAATRCR